MIEPQIPADEEARLETLQALRILDSLPEERFDRITRLAKRIFGVPISLVSLVDKDRQWFKSKTGLDAMETPRNISFCGHAINGDDIFIVPDTLKDNRFHDNPLVLDSPHIRFYAGYPLRFTNGHALGTLCLIDDKPGGLDNTEKQLLRDLGTMVEQEIANVNLATTDELTKLSNRRGFNKLAEYSLSICERSNATCSLAVFDLDNLKLINDNYGHAEGDRALTTFAELARQSFRDSDAYARLGGDEFAVLFTGSSETETLGVLQRFLATVNESNRLCQRGYDLEYSVGHACRKEGELLDSLFSRADQLMYQSKNAKKKQDYLQVNQGPISAQN